MKSVRYSVKNSIIRNVILRFDLQKLQPRDCFILNLQQKGKCTLDKYQSPLDELTLPKIKSSKLSSKSSSLTWRKAEKF